MLKQWFSIDLVDQQWRGECLRCGSTDHQPFLLLAVGNAMKHALEQHEDQPVACELFGYQSETSEESHAPHSP